jgi:RsiW-degrading membrane proteinase PrsW (M82 family)
MVAITVILVFLTSCVGLGYLVAFWARRYKWPWWASGLLFLVISVLWPTIVISYMIFDAHRYLSQNPHDDAPGMVVASTISIGAPLLFFLSLLLAIIGAFVAGRSDSQLDFVHF